MSTEINLVEMLKNSGISLTDLPEWIGKASGFMQLAKEKFAVLKEWEDSLKLKENQRVIYAFVPFYGSAAEENEIFIMVAVMEERENGQTIISNELYTGKAFEQAEKLLSYFPKTK